jgi:hypothetical protein
MERLIQLLDDLDDLLSPALAFASSGHWLRGAVLAVLTVLLARAAGSWPLALVLALAALPAAELLVPRLRRLAPGIPARSGGIRQGRWSASQRAPVPWGNAR